MSTARLFAMAALLLMVAPGAVMAQSAADLALTGVRVHAGWYDTGDFGSGPGFGLDLLNEMGRARWVLGFEWRDLDPPVKGTVDVKHCYGLALGFEMPVCEHDGWGGFAGAAGTWHNFVNAQDDGAFGGRVYVGAEAGAQRQFDGAIGYDLRGQAFDAWDSDGLFARVGYKVRF